MDAMKAPWWEALRRHWAERVLELRNNLQNGGPFPPVPERASSHDLPPAVSHTHSLPPLASVAFIPRREAEPAAEEAPCKQYAVKTGDCLYGISRQFDVDVKTLLSCNPHLSNPDSLPLGATLSVPLSFTSGVPNSSKLARIALPASTPLPRTARPQITSAKVVPRNVQQAGAARALQMRVAAIAFSVCGKLLLGAVSGGPRKYTVVKGDTLAKIAARHKTSVAAIKQVNKLKNDVIVPGRTLAIPTSARPATLQKASLAEREAAMYGLRQQSKEILAPISPNPVFQQHAPQRRVVVRPGDTLSEIARTHRMTVQELMRLNNLKGYNICAGDILALSPAPRTPVESIRKGPRRSRMYLFSRGWDVCAAQRKPGVGGGVVKQARWQQRKTKPFNDCWRFNCPLQSGFISSPYGPRKLAGQRRSIHYGVDIAADTGTPILAADRGVIAKAAHHFWDTDGYGNYVDIVHSGNFLTRYAHCQSLLVREGQRVSRGQEIATVGATGNAQGPHLHFEVRKEGKTVNPAQYTRLC